LFDLIVILLNFIFKPPKFQYLANIFSATIIKK
jgi:hypothetical protein